ncbi:MAG: hypothetical protein R3C18_21355 [Planctomycetaceae bacterium]
MQAGIFDPDTLFTLILLNEIGIDPSKPYSSEHGADPNSIEFKKYQRALVHEKAHYFTLMGSSLFARRFLSQSELSFHLSNPGFAGLQPYAAQSTYPDALNFWLHEFCADSFYFEDLAEGQRLDSKSKGKLLIREEGVNRILNAYGWDQQQLEEIYSHPSFVNTRTTALVEGIGRAQEYLMLVKRHIGTKIDVITSKVLSEFDQVSQPFVPS